MKISASDACQRNLHTIQIDLSITAYSVLFCTARDLHFKDSGPNEDAIFGSDLGPNFPVPLALVSSSYRRDSNPVLS
ncbi:hypothetical protein GWI33_000490 [Rhynchophorus ferrugineus]|uniref:Uncharacterized protein n=1 Tax=Rhynchophorus ferrugineus TaxID=354439 RepID=A0A834HNW1_RHYFE|nr:hypothetical protein GWI33_000490 [Rhynchophorus ferrugineus]